MMQHALHQQAAPAPVPTPELTGALIDEIYDVICSAVEASRRVVPSSLRHATPAKLRSSTAATVFQDNDIHKIVA